MTQTVKQLRAELTQRNLEHINDMKAMSRQGEELTQAREELADAQRVALSYLRMATKRKKELVQTCDELAHAKVRANKLDTALTDACAARDALARELGQPTRTVKEYKKELAQARAQLAQTETERINDCRAATMWEGIAQEREHELEQARAELKDLQVANRVCEKRLEHQTSTHNFWFKTCLAAEAERDKARKEAQAQSDGEAAIVEAAEMLRRQLKHAEDMRDFWIGEYDEMQGKRDATKRQLAGMEAGRDFWRREYERNDKHQATVAEEAAIVEAAEMLAEKTGKVHVASALREELAAARNNMYSVLEHRSEAAAQLLERLAEAEAKLTRAHWLSPDDAAAVSEWARWGKEERSHVQERLATLDNAEAALTNCGLTGIYDEFDGLADAIQQMVKRLVQLEGEPVEVEITGMEMVEALQAAVRKRRVAEHDAHTLSKALDEQAQVVRTEQVLRLEAEAIARDRDNALYEEYSKRMEAERRAKNLHRAATDANRIVDMALDACLVKSAYCDGCPAGVRDRIFWLAERAERAEALAALVTEKAAALLERAADHLIGNISRQARELAAQIREALDDKT